MARVVTLVSGGLDSTLMTLLALEAGLDVHPLFVNYGQRAALQEWKACVKVLKTHKIRAPKSMNLVGFGQRVRSGLTTKTLDVVSDAFLPGRNLLLLLAGAAYAATVDSNEVAIGLLDESQRLFEDQSSAFLERAQLVLGTAVARNVAVRAPLIQFTKKAVVAAARAKKIQGTYSCHSGTARPCGNCLSCRELSNAQGVAHGRQRKRT